MNYLFISRKGIKLWKVLSLLFLGVLEGCSYLDAVPIIGLDGNNNPVQIPISEKEYLKRVTTTTTLIENSMLPVLNKRSKHSPWLLRVASVGTGILAQIGVGPFQFGVLPRLRYVFTSSSNPANVP